MRRILQSSALATMLLTSIVGLSACWTLRHEDVSVRPKYENLIGRHYVLAQPMNISGVNLPPGYGPTIDTYLIEPVDLNWSGPELITRDILPAGTTLTVESIWRCTNCPFEDRLHALVAVDAFSGRSNVPIRVNLHDLVPPSIRVVEIPN